MKREARLYINGNEVDLELSAADLAISYSIEDIEPGKIKGAYAKRNVKVPATTGNREIFQDIEVPAAESGDAVKLLPARIEVNGVPVLSGKAQLTGAELSPTDHRFGVKNYNVSVIGANADWFKTVGSRLVRDLGWTDLLLSVDNVQTLGDADPATAESCFTLIKWKPWQQETAVTYEEHTPALFIRSLLNKAFEQEGYNLTSCFDNEPFSRLIIPVPLNLDGEYLENVVNVRAEVTDYAWSNFGQPPPYELAMVFPDDSTPPNKDGGDNYDTGTGIYTAPISANYLIKISGSTNLTGYVDAPLGGTYNINWLVYKNGDVQNDSAQSLAVFGNWTYEYSIALEAGDQIQINIQMTQATGSDGPIISLEFDATLEITADKELWEIGELITFASIIPGSWMVKDIIQDLTRVFNLAWETDVQAGTVFAWPRDAFTVTHRMGGDGAIQTTTSAGFFRDDTRQDIGRKIDLYQGGEIEVITDYQAAYVLAWATDDPTAEAIETQRAANIYSAKYQFPQDRFQDGSRWLYTNWFAKTYHLQDTDISSGANAFTPQVPLLFGENYLETPDADPDYSLAPRLLYHAGRRGGLDGYLTVYNSQTSASSAYDYPAAFMVNYNDPCAADFSLSFCDETTNYGGTLKGLFNTFHIQEAKRIELGRFYDHYVLWDEKDISQLSFRNKLTYDGANFILFNVDGYSPLSNKATKTRMLLDRASTTTDAGNVSGPVLLEGATAGGGSSVGSGSGLIGAGGTLSVTQYHFEVIAATSNIITLPANSGIVGLNTKRGLILFQNGQKLNETLQYTVAGLSITVSPDVHWDGCSYEGIITKVS